MHSTLLNDASEAVTVDLSADVITLYDECARVVEPSVCAACGKGLLDRRSRLLGLGPDCRVLYAPELKSDQGHIDGVLAATRSISLGVDVPRSVCALYRAGFSKLARRVAEREACAWVTFTADHVVCSLRTMPRNFVRTIVARTLPDQRRLKSREQSWVFALECQQVVWRALRESFRDELVWGPGGPEVL